MSDAKQNGVSLFVLEGVLMEWGVLNQPLIWKIDVKLTMTSSSKCDLLPHICVTDAFLIYIIDT